MIWRRAACVLLIALPGGGSRATAAADTAAGVCVLTSGGEHRNVADEAQRALGPKTARLDVKDPAAAARLPTECDRLVVAVGPDALRAAAAARTATPVVFAMVSEPGAILDGKRPVSGLSRDTDPARVFALLRQIAPRVRRIGAVYSPNAAGALVAAGREAARANGLELHALPVATIGDAIKAFHRFEREIAVDALWLLPDAVATQQETVHYALEIADWKRIAVVGLSRWYVAQGALFALAPRPETHGAQAARLALDVLRSGKPQGIRYAAEYALYVNARAARRLGLKLPADVLAHAEEVTP